MRIVEIKINDYPPIKKFEISNLSDNVVLAGPNGIGKTRLIQKLIELFQNPRPDPIVSVIIESTCNREEKEWEKKKLSTIDQGDTNTLSTHLQKKRKRGKWTSSIINFDSSRTYEQIQAFQWSWDFLDPFEEEKEWNLMMNPFKNRFQDTIQALYKKMGHYRTDISKRYEKLRMEGKDAMPIDHTDPLQKFKDVFNLLLSPKELANIPLSNPRIQYYENGQLLSIDSLSSGEREVFTIVFDLLLHEPSDCVVFFDEPEMHLHPELSFRLLKALHNIGERNQFIFCTHSPDIITESIEHSVIFIRPPDDENNQAIDIKKDEEKATALSLLGQNLGVIALGRKIVLIEGTESSLDKQIYGEIVGGIYPQYVLVPTGGKKTSLSFSQIVDDVLSKALWGIDFYMIVDHDCSLPDEKMEELITKSKGRLAFLPKYHLENYFLDETTISKMFEKMETEDSWLRDPTQIRNRLKDIAKDSIPFTVQLELNAFLQSEIGNVNCKVKEIQNITLDEYLTKLEEPLLEESSRINSKLDLDYAKKFAKERWETISELIEQDDDKWKIIMPGRTICDKFSGITPVDKGRFKTLYFNQAKEDDLNQFEEIIDIFKGFETAGIPSK